MKLLNPKRILLIIILVAAFFRLYRLDYPNTYVFDEVYHAFTAKEYALNHKEAWEWWTTPPPGVAYEWTHPPLAKEIMAGSILLFQSEDTWVYRLPGALFGILSIYLIYLITKQLFKKESVALTAAFFFSIDGLVFVLSRTAMNDIYFITFMLATTLFFLRERFFLSALFLGMALSSKWTGFYLIGFIVLLYFYQNYKLQDWKETVRKFIPFLIIPPIVYLISYLPFFLFQHQPLGQGETLLGHNYNLFIQLQQQMWWYHTNLKATHAYASPWWSWPLTLYPVWYFVEYHPNGMISNIFASGNPMVFFLGFIAIIYSFIQLLKKRTFTLLVVVLGYLAFWLPWALSPRIMFLYHYSPSVPFLCIALSYQLFQFIENKKDGKYFLIVVLGLTFLAFLLLYPLLTGEPLTRPLIDSFFLTNRGRNPWISGN